MHHPFFILSLFVLALFYGTLLLSLAPGIRSHLDRLARSAKRNQKEASKR